MSQGKQPWADDQNPAAEAKCIVGGLEMSQFHIKIELFSIANVKDIFLCVSRCSPILIYINQLTCSGIQPDDMRQ